MVLRSHKESIASFIDEVVLPNAGPLPVVPPELRGDPFLDDGWFLWIAVPSLVTEEDLDNLERQFRVRLPPLFREYFLYKQILDGDFGIVRVPDMTPPDPLANLRSQMSEFLNCEVLQNHALLPFAQDGNDGGPICFKIDEPTSNDDYPIYFTDHELLRRPGYSGEKRWDSFEHLLDDIRASTLARNA